MVERGGVTNLVCPDILEVNGALAVAAAEGRPRVGAVVEDVRFCHLAGRIVLLHPCGGERCGWDQARKADAVVALLPRPCSAATGTDGVIAGAYSVPSSGSVLDGLGGGAGAEVAGDAARGDVKRNRRAYVSEG